MATFVIGGDGTSGKQHLAKLLKELRGSTTQRQFAQRLGTSYTSIQDWEKQIRLPSDKNLKRIAQLKGWTFEELILFLFGRDTQSVIATTDPLEIIAACVKQLSPVQRQALDVYFTSEISDILDKSRVDPLSPSQKHNLHLLLRASLKQKDPLEAVEQAGVDPELFADIFLRNAQDRLISYAELEQLSRLCYQVIRWRGKMLPEINPERIYDGKIETLFNDLLALVELESHA